MSQPSSNFGDDGMFGDPVEFEEGGEMPPQPSVAPAPLYRKQGLNVYTVMLIISFLALTTAAILSFIDVEKFN